MDGISLGFICYYAGIYLAGLRRTKKGVNQDNLSPGRDLNTGIPEYEAGVPATRLRHLCFYVSIYCNLRSSAGVLHITLVYGYYIAVFYAD
jgi:hypothetical protein